jgi:hypothetical protein
MPITRTIDAKIELAPEEIAAAIYDLGHDRMADVFDALAKIEAKRVPDCMLDHYRGMARAEMTPAATSLLRGLLP